MKKLGFSIIEILIVLIAVSIIMGTLTPAIIKKLTSTNVIVQERNNSITSNCNEKFTQNCKLCSSQKCLICKLNCPVGETKSNAKCSCFSCNDETKYGTGCTDCNEIECKKCNSGYYLSNKKCTVCPIGSFCNDGITSTTCPSGTYSNSTGLSACKACATKIENCIACNSLTGQCETCEEGYTLTEGICEEEVFSSCGEEFDNKYFMKINMTVNSKNYDICITKYNMGDIDILTIPNTVTTVEAGSGVSCGSSSDYSALCCWNGATTNLCNAENGGYSGCTRTVCTWAAANEICNNFNYKDKTWQLLTIDELRKINLKTYAINLGKKGLMLCSAGSGFGLAHCNGASYCTGAKDNFCVPHSIWSGTYNSTHASRIGIAGTTFSDSYYIKTYGLGVRCGFKL